jgi:LacI family transcriptional regulator
MNRNVYADRLDGYNQALRENGIELDSSLIIYNNLNDEGGAEAAQQILKMSPLPDGIFTANDTSAVACMRELKRSGISIPGQIAVVGFNIEPNLSTVYYPGEQMGEIAATTLINKLKNLPSASLNTIILRHELIVRESSLRL